MGFPVPENANEKGTQDRGIGAYPTSSCLIVRSRAQAKGTSKGYNITRLLVRLTSMQTPSFVGEPPVLVSCPGLFCLYFIVAQVADFCKLT